MKKLFFAFAVLALSTALFTTSSCSKDDDELVGTTWRFQESHGSATYLHVVTLKFTTNTTVMYEDEYIIDGEHDASTEMGTYTYNKPTIKITIGGDTATGTVSGNTMAIGELLLVKQ